MAEDNRPNLPESPNSMMLRRTLALAVVCGIVAFLVLGARLFKLQIIDHDFYEAKAIGTQLRETTVVAERGTIYDTNMNILAMSASVYDIYLSPVELYKYDIGNTVKVKDEDGNVIETVQITEQFIADKLAEILGLKSEDILPHIGKTKSWYEKIARKVEPEVSDAVREFKNTYNIVGLRLEDSSKRYYPYSNLAAQVIGFVGNDDTGLAGIEAYYNDVLTGENGTKVRLTNAVGTEMLLEDYEYYYDGEDGESLVLTIDSSIEYYLQKHLEQAVSDYEVANGAAAIAMDVDTGAILGMVSLGDFDLNNYQIVSDEAQEIIDAAPDGESETDTESKQALLNKYQQLQWRNKAINDTYEPGSTFKIITLSMALNEGVVSEDDTFYCGGSIQVAGDTKPRSCWKSGGHGSQTLLQALQHSCNVAFIEIGQRVGEETFYKYCEAFGFFNASEDETAYLSGKTGIDLYGEAGSIWWPHNVFCDPDNKSQLAAASFGQTFTITPLQLITAVSACCNGGNLMKPYLVKQTLDSDGTTISTTEPTVVRQVISEQTSAKVCEMLEQVVGDSVEGTGKNAYVAGYRIGGKTGTSEKVSQEVETGEKEYIVSFIGIAPMDDPKIAILVLLDNPETQKVYVSGGQMAAPTVGKMFADILPYMGYEPEYTDAEQQTIDRSMPDLSGMTLAEAQQAVTDEGFTYRVIGTGDTVTSQLPAANAVIASESQVIIYCDAEPSGQLETMPDLTNLTYSIARQQLGGYALFVRSNGAITNASSVVVTNQSVAAGTQVEHGTVIEVTVTDVSNLGRY
jgi:stage V sporulation protein D (sporulation-specific penicillin-binding protein)